MELYGWDIIYGATVDIINKQLSQQMASLITTFDYSRDDKDEGITITFEGQFGTWSITGGQDSLIEITMPIQKGSMTLSGANTPALLNDTTYKSGVPFDVSNISIKVNLPLSFQESPKDQNQKVLVFSFVAKGDGDISASDIVIVGINDPTQKMKGASLPGIFNQAFRELLTSNRSKISYEFASVMTQGGSNNWGSPKYASFYYSKPENSNVAYFHILAMVYRDNANGISPKLDPVLFSNNLSNRYLAFSKDLLLHGMVQPSLPWAIDMAKYPDILAHNKALGPTRGPLMVPANPTPDNDFQYNFDTHTITSSDIDLNTTGSNEPSDESTDSSMTMQMQVVDNAIKTTIDCVTFFNDDVGNQMYSQTVHGEYNNLFLYDAVNKQFVTKPDPNPVIVKKLYQNPNISPLEWLTTMITEGIGMVLLPLFIEYFTTSENVPISGLIKVPITWNGLGQDFEITSAALSGNIYLTGKS